MTIKLPLPSRTLSPNASRQIHFGTKGRAVKKARMDAGLAAIDMMNRLFPGQRTKWIPWNKATALCRFYFKTNRGQDGDNALGSCKAYFDGLADAGVVVNDKVIQHLAPEIHFDKNDPRVEIEILEVPA